MKRSKEYIEKKVRTIICDTCGCVESDINDDSHIIHDLGMDSLDAVAVVMDIEIEFNIAITDFDGEKYFSSTFDKMVEYLVEKLK